MDTASGGKLNPSEQLKARQKNFPDMSNFKRAFDCLIKKRRGGKNHG